LSEKGSCSLDIPKGGKMPTTNSYHQKILFLGYPNSSPHQYYHNLGNSYIRFLIDQGFDVENLLFDDHDFPFAILERAGKLDEYFSVVILSGLRWLHMISKHPISKLMPNPIIVTANAALEVAFEVQPIIVLPLTKDIEDRLVKALRFIENKDKKFSTADAYYAYHEFGLVRSDLLNLNFSEQIWAKLPRSIRVNEPYVTWGATSPRNKEFTVNVITNQGIELTPSSTKIRRRISKDEFFTVTKHWPDYLSGKISRSQLREVSRNLSYIFAIIQELVK
jgi:hypothetical protein